MREWVTLEEVYAAYLDCRRRKRSSYSCSNFERGELINLYSLYEELNNRTYTIGKSDAFCVTRPKVREVFAADFRDRIVHHLVIGKTIKLFENYFCEDTYNCRKGKGTDYGINRVNEMLKRHPNGWVIKCDLKGFFMSIRKDTLWDMLNSFLCERYDADNKEYILELVEKIVMHRPQMNCKRKGNFKLWDDLPKNKSLFTIDPNCGLAIGNLTSQIYANFYLSTLDNFITAQDGVEYGRYVDDFVMVGDDKRQLLALVPKIRDLLAGQHLKLHPDKIYIQPVRHGVNFIGSTLKGGRVYAGNRTKSNVQNLVAYYNTYPRKEYHIESFVQRYNSYMGYLIHRYTYAIRRWAWDMLSDDVKKYIYINGTFSVMSVRKQYKLKTKNSKTYGKKSNEK